MTAIPAPEPPKKRPNHAKCWPSFPARQPRIIEVSAKIVAVIPIQSPNGYHQKTRQAQMPKHIDTAAIARRVVWVIGVIFWTVGAAAGVISMFTFAVGR